MDQDWFTEVSWTSPHLVHILDCKWNRQVFLQTSRLLAIRIVHNSEDGTHVSLQFLRPPWTSVFKLYHKCHTPTDIQVKPPSFILHLSESPWHNWPSMLVKGWAPQWVWPHPCLLPWTPGFISISEVLLGSWFMTLNIARIANAVHVTLWLSVKYLNRCLFSHCSHCSQCLLVSTSVY